jgi:hypothetical protein
MNAYLFTGWVSRIHPNPRKDKSRTYDPLQISDICLNQIIHANTIEEAEGGFEDWLLQPDDAGNDIPTRIRKIAQAKMVDKLFTEAGPVPLDWQKIAELPDPATQEPSVDEFEQGYWADVNDLVRPGALSPDVDALQASLPEDVRSGLNWTPGRNFHFLISVLAPPVAPVERDYEPDADAPAPETGATQDETGMFDTLGFHEPQTIPPECADKEAAALGQARNSVIAAWLWRRFVASTQLADHEIRIDPLCGWVALESDGGSEGRP